MWLAELAPLTDGSQIPGVVAAALGMQDPSGPAAADTVIEALSGQESLILLDNCEHLIDAAAKFCDQVIRQCPKVRFLATSREPLGIDGERVYRVPSLTLPGSDAESVEDLAGSDAVQLFAERARTHQPDFVIDALSARDAVTICRRLDGIPLALELAAARLSSMSLAQVAARLDQRFRLLTGGSRNAMPRQQTLQATVDWSFGLLTGQERETLTRLSVFAGGFDLEAAEALCASAEVDALDVLDLLGSLVDKSLVVADHSPQTVRYRLLETIRQYSAQELLRVGGRRRGPAHQGPARSLLPGPGEGRRPRHDRPRPGQVAAPVRRRVGEPAGGVRPIRRRGMSRRDPGAGRQPAPVQREPRACRGARLPPARPRGGGRRAERPARGRDDGRVPAAHAPVQDRRRRGRGGPARTPRTRGPWRAPSATGGWRRTQSATSSSRPTSPATCQPDTSSLPKASPSPAKSAMCSCSASICRAWPSPHHQRRSRLAVRREVLACCRQAGDDLLIAAELNKKFSMELHAGLIEEGSASLEEAITLSERIGGDLLLHFMRANMTLLRLIQGRYTEAAPLLRGCLLTSRRLGPGVGSGELIFGAACIAGWQGDDLRAARLHGAGDVDIDASLEIRTINWSDAEQSLRTREQAALRARLGDAAYDEAYRAGARLSLSEALDLALGRDVSA